MNTQTAAAKFPTRDSHATHATLHGTDLRIREMVRSEGASTELTLWVSGKSHRTADLIVRDTVAALGGLARGHSIVWGRAVPLAEILAAVEKAAR